MEKEPIKYNTLLGITGEKQIIAHRTPWSRSIEIAFSVYWPQEQRIFEALPAELKDIGTTNACAEIHPFLSLQEKEAQQLMDSLWNCGLRPSEGTGSAGQLASVQYHLEDMRKLVFNRESEEQK